MNLNKVFLIGNLTRDPEVRSLPSGQPVATFGLATNRVWKDQAGQQQQQVEFHNIVAFGRLADIVRQYSGKGKMLLVEGRLQTRSWQGQDGAKRSRTEIVAERIQLGPRGTGSAHAEPTAGADASASAPEEPKEALETIEYPEGDINPDDIPF